MINCHLTIQVSQIIFWNLSINTLYRCMLNAKRLYVAFAEDYRQSMYISGVVYSRTSYTRLVMTLATLKLMVFSNSELTEPKPAKKYSKLVHGITNPLTELQKNLR